MNKTRKDKKVNMVNKHSNPTLRRRTRFGLLKRGYYKLKIALIRYLAMYRFFVTLALLFGIAFFLNVKYWHLPVVSYKINPTKFVGIEGESIVSEAQVMKCFKDIPAPKVPIYLMNTDKMAASIMKLAPVKKVYIRRFWFPARIKIVVEEKMPILAISPAFDAAPIAVFTEDGSIINKEFLPLKPDYKTFLLLTHEDYAKWDKQKVFGLIKLAKYIEECSGEKLQYIDIRMPNDVYVQLQTLRVRVGDLNNTVNQRVSRISSVLPQIEDLKRDINYLDLRWDNSTYIKLKDKNAPPPKPATPNPTAPTPAPAKPKKN